MPNYSTFERLQLKAMTKAASLVMAPSVERAVYGQFRMTVHAVTDLAPHLRRITFRAPELADHRCNGPDEYFGLMMPPAGRTTLELPSADRFNVRQAIRRMPEDRRPELRWYTVRAHRPADAEIDVDFVLHGDAGPGSRWASAASPGDEVGFRAGTATYAPPPDAGRQLLAADETALPALSAILESRNGAELHAYVEVPDDSFEQPVAAEVTWLHRGVDPPGSRVLPAVADAALPGVDYAWLCGESALATGLRRHLVRDRSVDRRRIMFSGYWKLGQARG
ncbi:siderophore-interacting protein [Actinophytocola gossypii]|uniref:Siderophore-interacting protein n=1 Tax=Actinophytocola gossypii TaxID=2812003 RepID=A0ABT2J8P4_9PSEU|nr:siderophore-interacting protein [Actinophytocola gossypii]MCT2583644.1 siderophore-interacting protein [Actinophytocola gossypii]